MIAMTGRDNQKGACLKAWPNQGNTNATVNDTGHTSDKNNYNYCQHKAN
jgi:hypothetical protein